MHESSADPVAAIQAIIDGVTEFEAEGSIEHGRLAGSLRADLLQARAALAQGDTQAAVRALARFIDHVERQIPHHVTESAARALVERIVMQDWSDGARDTFYMYV